MIGNLITIHGKVNYKYIVGNNLATPCNSLQNNNSDLYVYPAIEIVTQNFSYFLDNVVSSSAIIDNKNISTTILLTDNSITQNDLNISGYIMQTIPYTVNGIMKRIKTNVKFTQTLPQIDLQSATVNVANVSSYTTLNKNNRLNIFVTTNLNLNYRG